MCCRATYCPEQCTLGQCNGCNVSMKFIIFSMKSIIFSMRPIILGLFWTEFGLLLTQDGRCYNGGNTCAWTFLSFQKRIGNGSFLPGS